MLNSNLTETNGKLIYQSQVVNVENAGWHYFAPPLEGYALISATNGDWDAKPVRVTGVSRQSKTGVDIVFFEKNITGAMRINLLWVKE